MKFVLLENKAGKVFFDIIEFILLKFLRTILVIFDSHCPFTKTKQGIQIKKASTPSPILKGGK